MEAADAVSLAEAAWGSLEHRATSQASPGHQDQGMACPGLLASRERALGKVPGALLDRDEVSGEGAAWGAEPADQFPRAPLRERCAGSVLARELATDE